MVSDDLHAMQTRINDAYARLEALPPQPERIYLTDEQIAACPRVTSTEPCDPTVYFTSIPVERVETVEESTPYRMMVEKAESEGYMVVPAGGSTIYAIKPGMFGDGARSTALNTRQD